MKKTLIPAALLGAAAGFGLRTLQLAKSYNAAGLIARGDKISLALYLICAAFGALILLLCLRQKPGVQDPAGKSRGRGLIVILAGLALLASYLPPVFEGGAKLIVPVLAFAAACAVVVEGVYHMGGAVGSLLGGCILPVYLAGWLISSYRDWSHDPMVADFCFPLLFGVFAMLAVYHLAAFRVGRGKRRTTAFFVGCALICAGPVLAGGDWRTILRAAAVSAYLIAEFWPYLAKPKPLPAPEKSETAPETLSEEPAEAASVFEDAEAAVPAAEDAAEETAPSIEAIDAAAEDAIPAVEQIDAAAEDAVPAIEEIDAAVEEAVPAIEEIEAAAEDAVPAVGEIDAAVEDAVPAVGEIDAAAEDAVPAVGEIDAAVEDAIPAVEQIEAAAEESVPAVEEVEAAAEESVPAVEQIDAAVEDAVPAIEEIDAAAEAVEVPLPPAPALPEE